MKLINIGCGRVYHSAWINIDANPASEDIAKHDVTSGLPFDCSSFDACYCSHLLEHLTTDEAHFLLTEIHRILKPGGIFRVVVPDLENIAQGYLKALEQAVSNKDITEKNLNYEWMVLELVDQMVRDSSGGIMGCFLKNCPDYLRPFVLSRIGNEAEQFWKIQKNAENIFVRLNDMPVWWFIEKFKFYLICCLAWLIGGRRGFRAFKEGWFRTSGEVHRWMYDRFSLGKLLENACFENVIICKPGISQIPEFEKYDFEIYSGSIRKPDSLFMEGSRK